MATSRIRTSSIRRAQRSILRKLDAQTLPVLAHEIAQRTR